MGDLNPHQTHRSLGLPNPLPQTASQSSQPFLHNTRLLQMYRLTDRQTEQTLELDR